jgi:hypothetical protein
MSRRQTLFLFFFILFLYADFRHLVDVIQQRLVASFPVEAIVSNCFLSQRSTPALNGILRSVLKTVRYVGGTVSGEKSDMY